MGATTETMQLADFQRWLGTNLAGKTVNGTKSKVSGSLVFLLENAAAVVERCEVFLGPNAIEVRGTRGGLETLPKLYIRGRFADWLAYFRVPSRDHARALKFYGPIGLLQTLVELLELRQGQVSLRAKHNNKLGGGSTIKPTEEDVP